MHQAHQTVDAPTQIDGLRGEQDAQRRRQQQHGYFSAAISSPTKLAETLDESRTWTPLGRAISIAASPAFAFVAAPSGAGERTTSTGRNSGVEPDTDRTFLDRLYSQYWKVLNDRSRSAQNSFCDSPLVSYSAISFSHSSPPGRRIDRRLLSFQLAGQSDFVGRLPLKKWVNWLQTISSGALRAGAQLSLFEKRPWTRWPAKERFPHNEAEQRVRDVLKLDFDGATEWLVITGYASLDMVLSLLAGRPTETEARLLLGTEPFPGTGRIARRALPAEIRDYWLDRGISILHSSAIITAREAICSGKVSVRTAPRDRSIHAKVYVANAVTIGSSNYTLNGLGRQTEANVRFETGERERHAESRALAEGLWSLGEDYTKGFLDLLDELLQKVTWQEALARGCAAVLEGEWARQYMRPDLVSELEHPLWPHQLHGITQAMWILENVGAVLIADAAGSGKTRMGAWVARAAFDRQFRFGFAVRPSPLFVTPPAVKERWSDDLADTGLEFPVYSHGPLSNARSRDHQRLIKTVHGTELLVVDEAHNFLNASDRTARLIAHYAENVLLFTATPINRSAGDLLALVDLLGSDNLRPQALKTLNGLRRRSSATIEEAQLNIIRDEIQSFTVRRTRGQLNAIADSHPDAYRLTGRRSARYPHHRARYYNCSCRPSDEVLARKIAQLADRLHGASRLPGKLAIPKHWQGTEAGYVDRVVASAGALARYHVMKCLRSSRAALLEHVHGTEIAVAQYLAGVHLAKSPSGNMERLARDRAGRPPVWALTLSKENVVPMLWDPEAHRRVCIEDADVYAEIARLTLELSPDREDAKARHLRQLGEAQLVLAFDAHVITLEVLRKALAAANVHVTCFTGAGGIGAKRQALEQLGLSSTEDQLVALCSDALSEGMNLQKAACVVHLDTPTVIRLAEQRAGRVDRMDSPHDEVTIWWPKDPPAFAPQQRDLLRERYETVADLLGANFQLPDEPERVDVEEIAQRASLETSGADAKPTDELYDAFRGVRSLVESGGLVPPSLYEQLRTSSARIQSCVSTVESSAPWAFFVVSGAAHRAPQWVFLASPEAELMHDLNAVSEELRRLLSSGARDCALDERGTALEQQFIERLRDRELELIPPRRARALHLLNRVLDDWCADKTLDAFTRAEYRHIADWAFPPTEARREPFPDPRSIADAWLALLRPRMKKHFQTARRRSFWSLKELRPKLREEPVPLEQLEESFRSVATLQPVEQRIVSMILGVVTASS